MIRAPILAATWTGRNMWRKVQTLICHKWGGAANWKPTGRTVCGKTHISVIPKAVLTVLGGIC
jgi:hypothetical protein